MFDLNIKFENYVFIRNKHTFLVIYKKKLSESKFEKKKLIYRTSDFQCIFL